jgi:hypothetical protein
MPMNVHALMKVWRKKKIDWNPQMVNYENHLFFLSFSLILEDIFGMDHDAYEHYIEDKCTNKTRLYGTVLKISPELINQIGVSMSNPFKKQLGQLTVYRFRLHFKKNQCPQNETLSCQVNDDNNDLLPFKKQIWPAYMGINGDCHANNRF